MVIDLLEKKLINRGVCPKKEIQFQATGCSGVMVSDWKHPLTFIFAMVTWCGLSVPLAMSRESWT